MKPSFLPQSKWEWLPNDQYGPVRAGCLPGDLPEGFVVGEGRQESSDPDLVIFGTAAPGVRLIQVDGQISEVRCEREFWVNDQNLVGMPIARAVQLVPAKLVEIDRGPTLLCVEFPDVGLMLWREVDGQNVETVSVTLDSHIEEDEL